VPDIHDVDGIDLGFLDDAEPPVGSDERLVPVRARWRQLRRRRRTTRWVATAAAAVVVAGAGVTAATHPWTPDRTTVTVNPAPAPPASRTASPSSRPSPSSSSSATSGSASPSAPETNVMPNTFVVSTDGLDPYLVGASTKQLLAKGWLTRVGGQTCATGYYVVEPHDPSAVLITVADGQIQQVAIPDNTRYRTVSGARIGTSEAALQKLYGSALVKVTGYGGEYGYRVGSGHTIGFWISGGKVSGLVAGTQSRVVATIGAGKHYEC
jgi:hypothetical protein